MPLVKAIYAVGSHSVITKEDYVPAEEGKKLGDRENSESWRPR